MRWTSFRIGTPRALREKLEGALDGILTVSFDIPYGVLVQSPLIELVHLTGMESLLLALYDEPETMHAVLGHMVDSKVRLLERLERDNLLFDNKHRLRRLGLQPRAARRPGTRLPCGDVGFADAKEFSMMSPDMFREFALAYQKRGLLRFGRVSYGCCEPLDAKYALLFAELPNLRRLSVSPWADVDMAAEVIGSRAILSFKPHPALVSDGFDEAAIADVLNHAARATKNCTMEVIFKDLRTVGGDPTKLERFCKLVRAAL